MPLLPRKMLLLPRKMLLLQRLLLLLPKRQQSLLLNHLLLLPLPLYLPLLLLLLLQLLQVSNVRRFSLMTHPALVVRPLQRASLPRPRPSPLQQQRQQLPSQLPSARRVPPPALMLAARRRLDRPELRGLRRSERCQRAG